MRLLDMPTQELVFGQCSTYVHQALLFVCRRALDDIRNGEFWLADPALSSVLSLTGPWG
ncbi:hypothetical protein VTO73DRAFT_10381 [Trametes versicolor]